MSLEKETYESFIYQLPNLFPSIKFSTLISSHIDKWTAIIRGEILFANNIILRVREVIDFDAKIIQSYSYEVIREDEKLYWYDSFPHPHISELSSTLPHHKHIPPDIKHHRIPSPELSLNKSNIPFLIKEIEKTLL